MTRILPHEKVWLREQIEDGFKENQQASDDMTEAIDSGNAWHDNAQYDEVRDRMGAIDDKYRPMVTAYREKEVVPYPEPTHASVALGSLLRYTDSYGSYDGLIVGMASLGEGKYQALYETADGIDFEIIGAESPLATAMMGREAGEQIAWEVRGNTLEATIETVDNAWLAEKVGHIAAEMTAEIDENTD